MMTRCDTELRNSDSQHGETYRNCHIECQPENTPDQSVISALGDFGMKTSILAKVGPEGETREGACRHPCDVQF
jgi:hypothetical protein